MDIRIDAITKSFDQVAALHGIDLDIGSGELIALLGPSGSGKTTLLRLIAGLERPSGGRIFFGDEDASGQSVQDRNVGFVFQSYALFRNMTVLDNVSFGLRVRPRATRPSRAEIRRRAMELLELVQLSGLDRRFPQQLSGGQRQRVALARALAIAPRVLLLDEPFGALDAQVRRDLRKWLRALHERTGHTTVFVTHDQEEALELADRVVVMRQGRIEQAGTPDEVYDRPASPFVFSFIGEASALPAAVEAGELRVAGCTLESVAEGQSPGPYELWFRPADVELTAAGQGIGGEVINARRVAGFRHIELKIAGQTGPIGIELPHEAPIPESGRLDFRPRRWQLFPA